MNFHVKSKKKSVKQKYVNRFKKPYHNEDNMPIIFYGNGKWASGVKGTKTVPQDMIDMFKRSGFPVMKIKEPRTRYVYETSYDYCMTYLMCLISIGIQPNVYKS